MLKTFRIGGIHPPENKLSAGKKITALAAPWLKPEDLFLQISIRPFPEK